MSKISKLLLCSIFIAIFASNTAAYQAPAPAADIDQSVAAAPIYNELASESEAGIYIIQLNDAPLATYTGGIAELAATSPLATGAAKLDVNSPASLAYEQFLASKQDQFVSNINSTLGRSVDVAFYYRHAYNGVAVELSPAEAAVVATLDGVELLYREGFDEILTDAGPDFLGAPAIWDAPGTGTKGEGIIVGILDTGINSSHPSFAAVGGDGYAHTNPFGTGNYVGYCVANPSFCNDKLIGAWAFHPSSSNPEDVDGHGSHTAGTVAGNYLEDAVLDAPTADYTFDYVSGVAPHANIIAYQVCSPSCPTSATTAAVNQAVIDGVDVTNYSISGGTNPYVETTAVAFRNAVAAGVFASNSAGNSGPTAGTVGHQGPWVMTVAASTHNRAILNSVVGLDSSEGPLADIAGQSPTAPYGPAPIVYAGGAPYNNPLCNPFPAGTFSGEIVVCDRGSIGRVEKGSNVLNAGGGGMILINDSASAASLNDDTHVLPATHISFADGTVLKNWLASGTDHEGSISGGVVDYDDVYGDNIASFSSRGPAGGSVPGLANIIKPDVTAPGLNIMAAYYNGFSGPPSFNIISGTSMSSPHAAGAAALIRAVHPDWTPGQVKSALMMTAINDVNKQDNTTPGDAFDFGAGRIDLAAATEAGFVLDITDAEYIAANPSTGGDPKTLNLPSLANNNCEGLCSWTRSLESTLSTDQAYTATVVGPSGITGTVSPASFTIPAGGTQDITINLNVVGGTIGTWAFAQVVIEPVGGTVPNAHFPIAARVAAPVITDPIISVDPGVITSEQPVDVVTNHTFNIDNLGTATLTWDINEADIEQAPMGGYLYDNGPFVTHPGAGPGGADNSILQSGLGMTSLGSNANINDQFRLADQFTVGTGQSWDIDSIIFYGYQTGSPTTSTFNHVNYRIWDGMPDAVGSSVVFGDTSTNRLVATDWTNAYRMSETNPGTTRPIMYIEASAGVTLPEGTYWIDWQLGGTLATAWTPPITIIGQTTTGDAVIYNPTNSAWGPVTDSGTATTQGMPFSLVGTESATGSCANPTDIPWVSVTPTSGSTAVGGSSEVSVSFDSTGLTLGTYEAMLCITSNDPATPLVQLPLTLVVSDPPVVYDVTVTATQDALSGTIGSSVMYHVDVTNNGDVADTFDITLTGNSWTAAADVTTVTLNPGETGMVMVTIDIPASAADGDTDVVTVTATSQTEPTATDSVDLTTTAVEEVAPTGYTLYLPIVIRP